MPPTQRRTQAVGHSAVPAPCQPLPNSNNCTTPLFAMGAILSILLAGGAAGGLGFAIRRHERRGLKVGSDAATPERIAHPSWDAVVDNYVYIHNAFRNDLDRIIARCENDTFVLGDLEQWRDILDLHSRVEDEIIVVALQARLKDNGATLPEELTNGKDHEDVKNLIDKAVNSPSFGERVLSLKQLATALDEHLKKEEETIMPLLLEHFTTRELWALDSFIVNPKLDYCDKETLIKITKW